MKTITLIALCLVSVFAAYATTVSGRFVVVVNNGTTYSVKMQLQTDVSAGLGGATLAFTFNTTDLSFPASPVAGAQYTFHAFSGSTYSVATVTRPLANKVSVNIEYNGNTGEGTPVVASPGWTDVVTITFTTTNPLGHSNLVWVTKQVLADDQITQWTNGTFPDFDTNPLPVQLSSFAAAAINEHHVNLNWSTLSEINNYGFYVQRKRTSESAFTQLANSFVPGHGTTNTPQHYEYRDSTAANGTWQYRLKQIDLDGTENYTDAIQVRVLTSVKEIAPFEYSLSQNYPNPFNPTTELKFSIAKNGKATVEIYNVVGQRIATLFNDVAEAGQYYKLRFDGGNVASGVYFYRMQSGSFTSVKKLLLLK